MSDVILSLVFGVGTLAVLAVVAWYIWRRGRAWPREGDGRYRTLSGVVVRSEAEQFIADHLSRRGIRFKYERPYPHGRVKYKPDFYLVDQDLYLEHLGVNKDGTTAPFVSERRYWSDIRWKRRLHQRHGTRMVETYHWQHADGILEEALDEILGGG